MGDTYWRIIGGMMLYFSSFFSLCVIFFLFLRHEKVLAPFFVVDDVLCGACTGRISFLLARCENGFGG